MATILELTQKIRENLRILETEEGVESSVLDEIWDYVTEIDDIVYESEEEDSRFEDIDE
jgi:hypothetical protein